MARLDGPAGCGGRVSVCLLGLAVLAVHVSIGSETSAVGGPELPGQLRPGAGDRPLSIPLGLDLFMPVPADNPVTVEKTELGRRLFFDTRLSADGLVACATCHDPDRAFTDGRPVARGIGGRLGTRNSPTLVNRGYGTTQFLDGRAATLEDQVLLPIEDKNELGHTLEAVVLSLRADSGYRRDFQRAFGREPDDPALAQALSTYVRSILSGNAAFDRYQVGDRTALTAEQQDGLRIFFGRGRCSSCHVGPTFTDEEFHNTGVAWRDGDLDDVGRFAVSGLDRDRGAFKTPTLREVARTAPYMHDGSLATLEDVVAFYDGGGRPHPDLDPQIQALELTGRERAALLAFLRALSGKIAEGTPTASRRPRSVR